MVFLLLAWGSEAQATSRLFQTIPTPTPRTAPPVPQPGTTVQPGEEPATGGVVTASQEMLPPDVLPSQEIDVRLQIRNAATEATRGVLLSDELDAALQPLEVRASQGAVRVQGQSVVVDLGTVEAGQTVLVLIRARVDPGAAPGQIILNEASLFFDGGRTRSNTAAVGLPPGELPATGRGSEQVP
jgi:hypothetical protein